MRHLKSYRKLGRESAHRRAMLRNLATTFLSNGKIKTTLPKAKELRPIVEKLITLGKKGTLHSRRQVESYLFGQTAAQKVFTDIAPRFKTRPGGYTRIVKYGERFGDGAFMCNLELLDYEKPESISSKEISKSEKTNEKTETTP